MQAEFVEYTLVVEGAVDEVIVTDEIGGIILNGGEGFPKDFDSWIMDLEDEARAGQFDFDVYRVHHGAHHPDADCVCFQYETSHLPVVSFRYEDDQKEGEL